MRLSLVFCIGSLFVQGALAQAGGGAGQVTSSPASQTLTLNLDDAIKGARANAPQLGAALTDAGVAREDKVQALAALLPTISYTTGAVYAQPRGPETPLFIAANGVREYISQGVAQESLSFASVADYRRARAAEALAKARAEIAARGLVVAVIENYYNAVVTQRKTANAQEAASEAQRFLTVSQQLEAGGEVAHSDVIKAQLQGNDRERDLQEARLAEEKAKLALAVLVFPNFNTQFQVTDDLRFAPPLPALTEIQQLAASNNPLLKAAVSAVAASQQEVRAAFAGHLPSLTINYFYGIDAPQYRVRSDGVSNLGYQVAATVNLPVWSWGATQSRVKQAELRRNQSRLELSAAQRQALADLQAFYSEAQLARTQLELLRQSADLAAESVRLTTLRYRGGEATVLEVVDAQNTLTSARNSFDDGEARYRISIANLQTLTGTF